MPVRTDLDMPEPDEDPISYHVDAVTAQGEGPQTTPWGPRETHGAVQEHNGGSYRLKHLRSAPQQEMGATSGQGRLFPAAVPYSDQRVGEVPQTITAAPNGEAIQRANNFAGYGRYSDAVAAQRRVQPPPHPVYFPRGRSESQAGLAPNPVPGFTNANGRPINGGVHRTDRRY